MVINSTVCSAMGKVNDLMSKFPREESIRDKHEQFVDEKQMFIQFPLCFHNTAT